MKETLQKILKEAISALEDPNCNIEEIRIKYLGKKGELTAVLRGMGQLSPEERPVIGQLANEVRATIEAKIEQLQEEQKAKAQAQALVS
ncbi:MAG: phenylalanine--tRNA ligase subunit alpha, partial [Clostridia bacterium]|nr:phenylalanine--tRNA ligase subunit alpha [Clostridia bacterium]